MSLCQSHFICIKPIMLKDFTTWKIGGKSFCFAPESVDQLSQFLRQYRGKIAVIGYGSNLLAPSEGFDGVCIVLKKNLSSYKFHDDKLTVQSGLSCPKLAKICSQRGFTGLNFLVGIPGSVGGAVVMNAGAHGGEIMPFVDSLSILSRDGQCYQFSKDQLKWVYRQTYLPINGIVTSITFNLRGDFPLTIREVMDYRARTQPLKLPSCGSCFKNPNKRFPAGLLIDQLGFKDVVCGGAQISKKHANFMINLGSATSDDILTLTNLIQKKTFLTTGLILQAEYQLLSSL